MIKKPTREEELRREWTTKLNEYRNDPNLETQSYWLEKAGWYALNVVKQEKGIPLSFSDKHEMRLFGQFVSQTNEDISNIVKTTVDKYRDVGFAIDEMDHEVAFNGRLNAVLEKITAGEQYGHCLPWNNKTDTEMISKIINDRKEELFAAIELDRCQSAARFNLTNPSYRNSILYRFVMETCPEIRSELETYLKDAIYKKELECVDYSDYEIKKYDPTPAKETIENQIAKALVEKCKVEGMTPAFADPDKCDIHDLKVGDKFIYDGVEFGTIADCAKLEGVTTFVVEYEDPSDYDTKRYLFSSIDCVNEYIWEGRGLEQYTDATISTCGREDPLSTDELRAIVDKLSYYFQDYSSVENIFKDEELAYRLKYEIANYMFDEGLTGPEDVRLDHADNILNMLKYELAKEGYIEQPNFIAYEIGEIKERANIDREI